MTREEILAVAESDAEGCNTINRLVHEKLGECWHDWDHSLSFSICTKCHITDGGLPYRAHNPDYAHDIRATWAIKEWLDKQGYDTQKAYNEWVPSDPWASPLSRCKSLLIMNTYEHGLSDAGCL
jgi:hypothetical protein